MSLSVRFILFTLRLISMASMPCFVRASVACRETLRYSVYPRIDSQIPLVLFKSSMQHFHASSILSVRSSPTASEHSAIFGLESSRKVDEGQVPFHEAVTNTKCHQRFLSYSNWKRTSSPSYGETQVQLCHGRVPRSRGAPGISQSYHRGSANVHRSSRDAVLRTVHHISTATTCTRLEDHDSTTAFLDEEDAEESVNKTRRIRNPRFNMQSHEEILLASPRIHQIQALKRRFNSESSVASESCMSTLKTPRESWQVQKKALLEKFGSSGWSPRKRLSPDALEGIRMLHSQSPEKYTTPVLAHHFQVSPEAIRRILKSKWRPNEEEEATRRQRWDKRGESIWSQMVEIGIKPPKKWRDMGVGKSKTCPVGISVGWKPSIKETLLVAVRPWDLDVAAKGSRAFRSSVPLSQRIL